MLKKTESHEHKWENIWGWEPARGGRGKSSEEGRENLIEVYYM
jgi:hypothetical protein